MARNGRVDSSDYQWRPCWARCCEFEPRENEWPPYTLPSFSKCAEKGESACARFKLRHYRTCKVIHIQIRTLPSVNVACVIGNDNTVALRQLFESADFDRHAREQERCPGRCGDPSPPPLEPGQEQSEHDAAEYAQDEGEPGVNGEQKSAGSKGRWRVQVVHLLLFFRRRRSCITLLAVTQITLC